MFVTMGNSDRCGEGYLKSESIYMNKSELFESI